MLLTAVERLFISSLQLVYTLHKGEKRKANNIADKMQELEFLFTLLYFTVQLYNFVKRRLGEWREVELGEVQIILGLNTIENLKMRIKMSVSCTVVAVHIKDSLKYVKSYFSATFLDMVRPFLALGE